VGWYGDIFENCNDVDKYHFTARHAKSNEEYDTLIVKLGPPVAPPPRCCHASTPQAPVGTVPGLGSNLQ
jgi:hypothetical protein